MLSEGLDVLAQTPPTTEYLRLLVPPDGRPVADTGGRVQRGRPAPAVEAGVDAHPASSRVHLHGGRWVRLRADRIGGRSGGARDRRHHRARPPRPTGWPCSSGRTGLSPRETELVGLVVDGLDGKEVAARMFLSPHTVQDHLKSVFAKTSTRSRREPVAMVRGH